MIVYEGKQIDIDCSGMEQNNISIFNEQQNII